MSSHSVLAEFLNQIESDITADIQPNAGNPADFREVAFTRMLADELDASGVLESPVICHCELGRAGAAFKVNGYGVPDEDSRLDLFVTMYSPSPHVDVPTLNASDVETTFNKLERYLGRALDGLHDELDPSLPECYMSERIHRLRGKFDRINFFLFSNARLAQKREKQRKPEVHGVPATYEIWDIERFRRLRESGAGYEALFVDLRSQAAGGLPCVRLDAAEDGFRTCVAIFPGTLLRDLYDEHGSRLLELNVRSYLQAKGKINQGILETLRKAPADFMAYNNGITVVADQIVFESLNDGREGIVELHGMQIVNGGQTTASIHRAAKEYGADLSNVYVQGKIVTVDPSRFNNVVPYISKYANSQNKVTDPDLQANHRFHVGLERVAKQEWTPDQTSKWFYERARGSYQTARARDGITEARRRDFDRQNPTNQRFTKEDLAKFENCWRGMPHFVNRGGQKNFTQFMTFVKEALGDLPDNWEPSREQFRRYVAKGILFRDVQRIVRADGSITAYRINITAYTAALLAEKTARRIDLDSIWDRQRISDSLATAAGRWAPLVFKILLEYSQRQTVHIDNILKSQAAWEHILALDLRLPAALEAELVALGQGGKPSFAGSTTIEKLSAIDRTNIALCVELGKNEWRAIRDWVHENDAMQFLQRGIARTLADYAAEDWQKLPSHKQAKHAVKIITAARRAGIIR